MIQGYVLLTSFSAGDRGHNKLILLKVKMKLMDWLERYNKLYILF